MSLNAPTVKVEYTGSKGGLVFTDITSSVLEYQWERQGLSLGVPRFKIIVDNKSGDFSSAKFPASPTETGLWYVFRFTENSNVRFIGRAEKILPTLDPGELASIEGYNYAGELGSVLFSKNYSAPTRADLLISDAMSAAGAIDVAYAIASPGVLPFYPASTTTQPGPSPGNFVDKPVLELITDCCDTLGLEAAVDTAGNLSVFPTSSVTQTTNRIITNFTVTSSNVERGEFGRDLHVCKNWLIFRGGVSNNFDPPSAFDPRYDYFTESSVAGNWSAVNFNPGRGLTPPTTSNWNVSSNIGKVFFGSASIVFTPPVQANASIVVGRPPVGNPNFNFSFGLHFSYGFGSEAFYPIKDFPATQHSFFMDADFNTKKAITFRARWAGGLPFLLPVTVKPEAAMFDDTAGNRVEAITDFLQGTGMQNDLQGEAGAQALTWSLFRIPIPRTDNISTGLFAFRVGTAFSTAAIKTLHLVFTAGPNVANVSAFYLDAMTFEIAAPVFQINDSASINRWGRRMQPFSRPEFFNQIDLQKFGETQISSWSQPMFRGMTQIVTTGTLNEGDTFILDAPNQTISNKNFRALKVQSNWGRDKGLYYVVDAVPFGILSPEDYSMITNPRLRDRDISGILGNIISAGKKRVGGGGGGGAGFGGTAAGQDIWLYRRGDIAFGPHFWNISTVAAGTSSDNLSSYWMGTIRQSTDGTQYSFNPFLERIDGSLFWGDANNSVDTRLFRPSNESITVAVAGNFYATSRLGADTAIIGSRIDQLATVIVSGNIVFEQNALRTVTNNIVNANVLSTDSLNCGIGVGRFTGGVKVDGSNMSISGNFTFGGTTVRFDVADIRGIHTGVGNDGGLTTIAFANSGLGSPSKGANFSCAVNFAGATQNFLQALTMLSTQVLPGADNQGNTKIGTAALRFNEVNAVTKNAVFWHPYREGYHIFSPVVESPQFLIMECGEAETKKGQAKIPFSEAMYYMTESPYTVQVTPVGKWVGFFVDSRDETGFTVFTISGDGRFMWTVYGRRVGDSDFTPIATETEHEEWLRAPHRVNPHHVLACGLATAMEAQKIRGANIDKQRFADKAVYAS